MGSVPSSGREHRLHALPHDALGMVLQAVDMRTGNWLTGYRALVRGNEQAAAWALTAVSPASPREVLATRPLSGRVGVVAALAALDAHVGISRTWHEDQPDYPVWLLRCWPSTKNAMSKTFARV